MGDQVMKFSTLTTNGSKANYPTWRLIMDYEYELRRKAYKLITEEGYTLVGALQQVQKGESDLRHAFFTTPYQIEVAEASYRVPHVPKGQGKEYGVAAIQGAFGSPHVPKGGKHNKGQKGKEKGKGKGKGKDGGPPRKKNKTDDGRLICYNFNKGKACDGSCGMLHVCQICEKPHAMKDHEQRKND